ncbi:MAG: hypothetical protein OXC12_00050 [Spirochaetaceae bacterium]|nr:hypothetical protein [Spirochaetaceae bacterium]
MFFHAGLGSLVGVVVGAVEILQRYRDAPFRAVFNPWGVGYIVLNPAVSYGAFWVLYYWTGPPPSDAAGHTDPLQLLGLSAGAGFGRATVFRARAGHHLPAERQGVRFRAGNRGRNAARRGRPSVGPAARQ